MTKRQDITAQKSCLKDKKCFIFDIDGTVALGTRPLPEAVDFILRLRKNGRRVIFYTNNPNRSHGEMVEYLEKMGFEPREDEMISAGDVTIDYLNKNHPESRVFLVGVPEMERQFVDAGIHVVPATSPTADVVVSGFDKTLTFDKAAAACRMIERGAKFICTHPDRSVPIEDCLLPDAGAIAAMIAAATDTSPIFMGKPMPEGMALIEQQTGLRADQMCMIGDRLYTDIAFGNRAGATSVLVLTGGTSAAEGAAAVGDEHPDVIVPHLGVLAELF
ncbi:MAG: HAD-IIA family hydrolase [Ruminococcaceae bacterium]|nr:HAD-IIA family hydrolase [Oscillospiraceae bacterium]